MTCSECQRIKHRITREPQKRRLLWIAHLRDCPTCLAEVKKWIEAQDLDEASPEAAERFQEIANHDFDMLNEQN